MPSSYDASLSPLASHVRWLVVLLLASAFVRPLSADDETSAKPRRLLLIGQKPDGHPFGTHEYNAGARIVAALLQKQAGVQCVVVAADGEWSEGPELLDSADGAFLFVSEGAKWLRADERRAKAFQSLAKRKGGLAVLHWGMGTKDEANIRDFVSLFGGCHGGPDRKYQVLKTQVALANPSHPICRGIGPFEIHEEFYYALKFPGLEGVYGKSPDRVTSLATAHIDETDQTVAWAWERENGGRSFGFTGGHFHKNWEQPEYRRLVGQGILWTLDLPIPKAGIDVELPAAQLELPVRETKSLK